MWERGQVFSKWGDLNFDWLINLRRDRIVFAKFILKLMTPHLISLSPPLFSRVGGGVSSSEGQRSGSDVTTPASQWGERRGSAACTPTAPGLRVCNTHTHTLTNTHTHTHIHAHQQGKYTHKHEATDAKYTHKQTHTYAHFMLCTANSAFLFLVPVVNSLCHVLSSHFQRCNLCLLLWIHLLTLVVWFKMWYVTFLHPTK